ncbi:MAG TPA: hypothetical protein VFU31_18700 [Candidatus Binatia bacterium]|nr:hypothetical protein [Candidatus Binatia bacterium]
MGYMKTVGASLGVLVCAASVALAAQGQTPHAEKGAPHAQHGQPAEQQSPMHHGMMGHGMGMPMSGMMCPMMGGGMGMGMMSMMGHGQTDPKALGQMLQLRGDILKAVGDVLTKHGKALEGAK